MQNIFNHDQVNQHRFWTLQNPKELRYLGLEFLLGGILSYHADFFLKKPKMMKNYGSAFDSYIPSVFLRAKVTVLKLYKVIVGGQLLGLLKQMANERSCTYAITYFYCDVIQAMFVHFCCLLLKIGLLLTIYKLCIQFFMNCAFL